MAALVRRQQQHLVRGFELDFLTSACCAARVAHELDVCSCRPCALPSTGRKTCWRKQRRGSKTRRQQRLREMQRRSRHVCWVEREIMFALFTHHECMPLHYCDVPLRVVYDCFLSSTAIHAVCMFVDVCQEAEEKAAEAALAAKQLAATITIQAAWRGFKVRRGQLSADYRLHAVRGWCYVCTALAQGLPFRLFAYPSLYVCFTGPAACQGREE